MEILIGVIIGIISLVLLFILIYYFLSKKDGSDYKDGGGKQVGGNNRISIFAPTTDKAGKRGEIRVNYNLRYLLRNDEYLMVNLLLPLKNGHKTEIDCLMISRKGVFCIETKNWVGTIRGNDEDEYWTQKYDDPYLRDRQHKNPVIQNKGHCASIERFLNNKYTATNVVIITGYDNLLGVDSKYTFSLRKFISYYRELSEDELSNDDIEYIYKKLHPYIATSEELRRHRDDMKKRYIRK